MRILIINFELDERSGVLAWQASVAQQLAARCEFVVVVTSRLGQFTCPNNAHIHVVPKWVRGMPRRFGGRWLVNFDVINLIRQYKIDACFIHMAMEWAYVLAPALKLYRIPVLVWYAHGTVSNRLRLAHAFADRIVTSTPEGFRLPSKKAHVIGQGVDIDLFQIPQFAECRNDILYVGRVSPRKRIDLLVNVVSEIKRLRPDLPLRLRVIGPVLTQEDQKYRRHIQALIESNGLNGAIELIGFVPQHDIAAYYQTAFLHLNVSMTGSMDKTVLEALACGCPVLTGNEAFIEMFKDHPDFLLQSDRPQDIAQRALNLYENQKSINPISLRNLVMGCHDLGSYADKVLKQLEEILR